MFRRHPGNMIRIMSKPNIIYVLCDQLRRDALSCYGETNCATPNIDQLAREGVRSKHTCVTSPICVPYRFSFMTGQYAHSRWVPGIEYRMSPAERTLADEFNEGGYETVYVGKWHLDGGAGRRGIASALSCGRRPIPRHRQGRWQKWLAFELRNSPFDTYYFEDDDPAPRKIDGYQTDGLFDLAMNHLRDGRDRGKPFCCVISVEPPHPPFEAPHDHAAQWKNRELELPPNFDGVALGDVEGTLRDRRNYHAMVQNIDDNVGRLRAMLTQTGLADDTIIVFTADHGEQGGAHGLTEKQQPYEESVGVPLIVHDPRHPERAGATIDVPTCTEDLFPTMLGLAGLPARTDLPGKDFAPLLRGKTQTLDREGVMLQFVGELRSAMIWHDVAWRAFRTKRWMYSLKGGIDGATPWQLFDLEADPYEMNNLVNDPGHRAEATRLHRLLCERLRDTHDDFFNVAPAFDCDALHAWQ